MISLSAIVIAAAASVAPVGEPAETGVADIGAAFELAQSGGVRVNRLPNMGAPVEGALESPTGLGKEEPPEEPAPEGEETETAEGEGSGEQDDQDGSVNDDPDAGGPGSEAEAGGEGGEGAPGGGGHGGGHGGGGGGGGGGG